MNNSKKPKTTSQIKKTNNSVWLGTTKSITLAILFAFGIRAFIAEAVYIPSGSMLPTLEIDDRLLVEKLTGKFQKYQHRDMVVFEPSQKNIDLSQNICPINKNDNFIKRVIAVPGDIISIETKKSENKILQGLAINGKIIEENYLKESNFQFPVNQLPMKLANDEYFVMGDNRNNSCDGRVIGTIKHDQIIGKAVFRFWPINQVGNPYN
ncbi:signal peptidase I [Candidatus Gracilibacteria bacterium]|nr:signal peptidase I [Candidatus Gracilibacteria bacterium]NJS41235.1 signal peptidase I [Candidatus Gracilibacteria bacterium]